jgi:hypothetical protein
MRSSFVLAIIVAACVSTASSTSVAQPTPTDVSANPQDGATQLQVVLAGIAFAWVWKELVSEEDKVAIRAYLHNVVVNVLHRPHVNADTGRDVETVTVQVQGIDANGDNKADAYNLWSEMEDDDNDGHADDPQSDHAANFEQLKADLYRELVAHDAYLRRHGH